MISRLKKDLTRVQLKAMINNKEQREIDFKYMECLSKEYSTWRTVAIELNKDDYDILIDPNFWDPQLRIRKFIGQKLWRGDQKPRLTIQQRRESLKAQWEN